jgi:hypothetical protein
MSSSTLGAANVIGTNIRIRIQIGAGCSRRGSNDHFASAAAFAPCIDEIHWRGMSAFSPCAGASAATDTRRRVRIAERR